MTEEDTGGIPVRFGDAATMVKLAEMTGKNEDSESSLPGVPTGWRKNTGIRNCPCL